MPKEHGRGDEIRGESLTGTSFGKVSDLDSIQVTRGRCKRAFSHQLRDQKPQGRGLLWWHESNRCSARRAVLP